MSAKGRKLTTVNSRMRRFVVCVWRIYHGGEVTAPWIRERFGVARGTAHRDMQLLEEMLPVRASKPCPQRGEPKRIRVPRTLFQPMAGDD